MRLTVLVGFLGMIINVLFVVDFIVYAVWGRSLGSLCFDGNSLADFLLTYYPEMSSAEFIAANGFLLGMSVLLICLSAVVALVNTGQIVDSSSCRRSRP